MSDATFHFESQGGRFFLEDEVFTSSERCVEIVKLAEIGIKFLEKVAKMEIKVKSKSITGIPVNIVQIYYTVNDQKYIERLSVNFNQIFFFVINAFIVIIVLDGSKNLYLLIRGLSEFG